MINKNVKVNKCCIEALKGLVGHLFETFGNSREVVEASQYLDRILNENIKI